MRTIRTNLLISVFISLSLLSCKSGREKDAIMQTVAEWTGKKIIFPDGIPCQFLNRDTVCMDPHNPTTYKILLYVDSMGCNSCRLKLFEWKQLMAEADSLFSGIIDFLFFYQPKTKEARELTFQLSVYDFRHPVFMDIENQLEKVNQFPSEQAFQCFLLDQDNRVVLIGNPAINPRIWELFKEQISGVKQESAPLTTIRANPVRQELPGMKMGETYSCVFEIENTGNNPFVISRMISSCGCAVPTWERQPIVPGGKTEIRVEVKPDATGFFNKTIDVYGNIEQSVIKLSMIGTVE